VKNLWNALLNLSNATADKHLEQIAYYLSNHDEQRTAF